MDQPTKAELIAKKKQIIEEYLHDPATTGGRDRVHGHIKQKYPWISRADVAKVIAEDPVAQIHRPLKKRVTTRPIVVNGRAKQAQIDLVDMQKLANKNDGYRYWLQYVDLFSKYCAARPIKNKTQANVTAALLDILDNMPEAWRPSVIQSDRGSEFQSGMENALSKQGIKLIHSQAYNPRSQGAVERLNRTVKTAIFSLMARHETHRWIDFLEPLVQNINNSKHEATGYTPLQLMQQPETDATIEQVHARMNKKRPKQAEVVHHEFAIGDFVRVALTTESHIRKQVFRKKIMDNWSPNVYQIYAISEPEDAGTMPQYLLLNLATNRKSKKRYHSYQLQKVSADVARASVQAPDNEELPAVEEEAAVPVVAGPPRRSARAWAPSREGLRHFAART